MRGAARCTLYDEAHREELMGNPTGFVGGAMAASTRPTPAPHKAPTPSPRTPPVAAPAVIALPVYANPPADSPKWNTNGPRHLHRRLALAVVKGTQCLDPYSNDLHTPRNSSEIEIRRVLEIFSIFTSAMFRSPR
jgi:hypothetical protein